MSSDESGLSRWARRKAEARQRGGGAAPAVETEQGNVPVQSESREPPTGHEVTAESQVADLDLPDIESLTADSDFTVFMKDGVPPALRRLALRKLWASDPVFNVIDEMVEYGGDYTNAAMIVEGMKSAWSPGRGYARDEPPADGQAEASRDVAAADEADKIATDGEDAAEPIEGEESIADGEEGEDTELG